jgi:hypothetical protein
MIRCWLLLFIILVILPTIAQTTNEELTLTISTQTTTFTPSDKAIAHLIVKNTGKKITKGTTWGWFFLSKHKDETTHCTRQDCFIATNFGGFVSEIRDGKSFNVEVELTDLYWMDAISSVIDFSNPKNLFKAIPAGDYYLSFEFHNTVEPAKLSPDNLTIKSNQIPVKISSS